MESVYPVLSGALAQEKRMEVIANNLANAATSGFKKDVPVFEGVMASVDPLRVSAEGPIDPVAAFGILKQVVTDLSPGVIRTTSAALDVAIEGKGFFSVQTPEGLRYTRNGHFTINSEGFLALGDFPVLGSGGPITLPPGDIIIQADGRISVKGVEAGAEPVEIDLLPIYRFSSPGDLKKVGKNFFEAVNETAVPSLDGQLRQGALEGSNVNPVEEMVAMIEVMRLYEASQKAIQTADEIQGKVSNEIAAV
ncbi:MAG: flagellar basal-body rod protein FlgF [Nitrospiria bacterium]